MKLDVPVYRQQHEMACGAAALRMVLSYYGFGVTERDILKSVDWARWKGKIVGLSGTDLGSLAMKKGFKASAWAYSVYVDPKRGKLGKKRFVEELGKDIRKEKRKDYRNRMHSILNFIERGGRYRIRVPDIELIKQYIQKKAPVIVAVRAGILYENKNESGHYLVITGYDDNSVFYNDPYTGKHGRMRIKDFLYAWHANAHDSTMYVLVITP